MAAKALMEILDHPRVVTSWVCQACLDDKGKPEIRRIARVAIVPPREGTGRVWVALTDWGPDGRGEARQHIGSAGGAGYDKIHAALKGGTVGGFEIKDTAWLRSICAIESWEIIGSGLI